MKKKGRAQLPRREAPRDKLTREQLLELYYWMRLTRTLEERLVALYRQTKVVGGLFRSLGQEADAVGSSFALERRDIMSPLIRNLGSMLVKGRDAARSAAAVHGQRRFADARPRAEHPLRRSRARVHRPDLAARRHGAGDGRRDADVQDARRKARRSRLRRRRRDIHRCLSRGHQLRPRCRNARSSSSSRTITTPTRRQPEKQIGGEAVRRQGDRVRHRRRAGRWQRRARGVRRDEGGGRSRARAARA